MVVKYWWNGQKSNGGHMEGEVGVEGRLLLPIGQKLVKYWSNGGQTAVKWKRKWT